ncbi:MAG TPA: MAPEG family protein [Gammaproteobacteria bacterium]|nr:MAPEG family protein [Gammaproteobacteria bacterium]
MQPEAIFGPVVALVLLTFGVLGYTGYKRFSAGFAGRVRAGDFRYGETANVPPDVAVANRNFMNLLEAPVLFYTFCIAAYATHQAGVWALGLAWLYVALRIVHTFVHLTYNKILHRFLSYAAGNLVLLVMWLKFAAGLAGRPG